MMAAAGSTSAQEHRTPVEHQGMPSLFSEQETSALPSVTALVCAYNYERYIAEAIESAFAQDYPSELIEVLVIDDGSTDGTPELLRGYGDRIRVIRQPNGGLLDATAHGIREATGDLIAILDADDVWRPDKVRRQVDLMVARPEVGFVFSDLEVIDPDGRPLAASFWRDQGMHPPRGRALADFLCQNFATAPSVMFRRSFADHVLPIDPAAFFQDWWLAVRIAEVAEIDWVPEQLTLYRSHADNMSKKFLRNIRVDNRFRRWMLRRLDLATVTPAQMRTAWATFEDKLQLAATHGGRPIAAELPVEDADREELARRLDAARVAAASGDVHTAAREALAARACDPFDDAARDAFAALTDDAAGPGAPVWPLSGATVRRVRPIVPPGERGRAVQLARRAAGDDAAAWSAVAALELERARPAAAVEALREAAARAPLTAHDRVLLEEAERAAARPSHSLAKPSKSPGRVLILADTFPPARDDLAGWTSDLAAQLAKLGWQVDVATRAHRDRGRKVPSGARVHELHTDPLAGVVKVCQEHAFDAVLAVGSPDAWPLPTALKLPAGPRVAVVQIGLEATTAQLRAAVHPLAAYRMLLDRACAVGHVSASGPDARLLRDLGTDAIQVPLAGHAADANAAATEDDRPLLVAVGDLTPERHYGEMLRALSHHTGDWRLVIAGNAVPEHGDVGEEVKRLVRADARVEMRANVTAAEAEALIAGAALVLAPSTGHALARVVVRAMAHGVPWLAAPEYGTAEDLAGGIVLPVGEFAAGVEHLLGDAAAHDRLAAAGAAQFECAHRWREAARRVDAMLRGVRQHAPVPVDADAIAATDAVRAELFDVLHSAPAGPYQSLAVEALR
jgi:glycosyltransferase involved in cell wall biosynthesis